MVVSAVGELRFLPQHPNGFAGLILAEALDALRAAPHHHTLLFENDAVRVLDTCVRPGERTPVHTHRWPSVLYILSWSAFVRRDARGVVALDSRTVPQLASPPPVLWTAPLAAHSLENVGAADLHVVSVELKGYRAAGDARGQASSANVYLGRNSIVVSRLRLVRKPRTYLREPGVGYFFA